MNTAVKVGLIAAGIGVFTLIGKKAADAYTLSRNMQLRIKRWGAPIVKGALLSVPVTIEITNPTQSVFTVDRADVVLFFWQMDQYVKAGTAQITNIVLNPGSNDKTFTAVFDLTALMNDAFGTAATLLFNRALNLRADVQLTVRGVTFPQQSFMQQINV